MKYKGENYKLVTTDSDNVCRLCHLEKKCSISVEKGSELYKLLLDGCMKFGNETKHYIKIKK